MFNFKLSYLAIPLAVLVTACQPSQPMSDTQATTASQAVYYSGVYTGTLPCADCEGIETTLTLNTDSTYSYVQKYLGNKGQEFTTEGKYTVKDTFITISLAESEKLILSVKEGVLYFVDENLKPYQGKLAENYQLKKQS